MSDLSDLFQKDPLSLTGSDLDTIVSHYRANRGNYAVMNPKTGQVKKVRAKKAAKKTRIDPAQLDLVELIASKDAKS